MAREVLTVTGGKVTLSSAPSAGASVNVFNENDDCGTPLTATAAGQEVTVTGATDGGKVIVYYMKDITEKVQKISVKGSSFPKAFTVYGDTIMKTEDDELLPYKFIAYKVSPQSTMSISMSNNGDPATITVTCDLMVNENNEMLDLILEEG